MNWQPISTAPKDGTIIQLAWFGGGIIKELHAEELHAMKWGSTQRNSLFPDKVGMWVSPKYELTWCDDGEGGPTHWMPLPESPKL